MNVGALLRAALAAAIVGELRVPVPSLANAGIGCSPGQLHDGRYLSLHGLLDGVSLCLLLADLCGQPPLHLGLFLPLLLLLASLTHCSGGFQGLWRRLQRQAGAGCGRLLFPLELLSGPCFGRERDTLQWRCMNSTRASLRRRWTNHAQLFWRTWVPRSSPGYRNLRCPKERTGRSRLNDGCVAELMGLLLGSRRH